MLYFCEFSETFMSVQKHKKCLTTIFRKHGEKRKETHCFVTAICIDEDTICLFLLNGIKRTLSIYRIFVDSDNEDDETKFVDDDDDSDEGRPANRQAAVDDDDEEDELDKFMAGIEVR